MSILVTRPSPDGDELVSHLRSRGKVAWSFPLIEFSHGDELSLLPERLIQLREYDLVFLVSRHAVAWSQAELQRTRTVWPTGVHYFAPGRTTALAMRQISELAINYPRDRETSEALLQLSELQNISGKQALILRGNGGRELLGNTLAERGAQVTYCECYQRREKNYDGAQETHRWQACGVDTLVVTSGEMLQQLVRLIPELYHTSWLLRCKVLVVSERLAHLARELGWQDIQVADNADNDALLRALL